MRSGELSPAQKVCEFRDQIADARASLLAGSRMTVLQLGVNVPGFPKDRAAASRAFAAGLKAVQGMALPVRPARQFVGDSGLAALFVCDAPPVDVKRAAVGLEEASLVGRTWDIDVYGPDGRTVARADLRIGPRECFVCNGVAKRCAATRAHDLATVAARFDALAMSEPAS
ncbi:citrate lyase holo-[acyl-carrier protein] synthase [Xanthomonas oryzae]|uniref:citrate lyase holo-[acyl-carrier protein] synthase n=1 Tax=Xanthomonas oryzae TaxID=347 RepID=UPI0001693B22|nr:citrate lyase holo-[acyl-carrier protein] synthase [Xanthomonas oryzae]AKK63824.1 hypothetical protein FE36_08200 [Xanthomonas oryzae pv. oryzicola]MEC5079898.1 citrate lyase holo-[acyl-carrier protein] synthase [Xanthomonas oryzae pv. oryzicola]MEC5113344.1 citrate lyase holo-[acyl-carrier protein] synthase [Xanthomonas oryzae pv. oryzicola]OWB25906.1 hypothetical protein XocBAI20_16000 [Xanthomonas oryzae pv. oryzicola]OWB27804.1 hypothetical protein XocBAI21_15160 [Xanthomonas oryzae pv.